METGGWHSPPSFEFHQIVDLQLLCAMRPAGNGVAHPPERLLRHLVPVGMPPMPDESLAQIFETLLRGARYGRDRYRYNVHV